MPRNKRESFIYTILMCSFMVFIMTIYNISLIDGFSWGTVVHAWLGFPLAFSVGFLLDWFVVSFFAKGFAFKIAGQKKDKRVLMLLISTFMVVGMCTFMSLFGAIQFVGITNETVPLWCRNIPRNFLMALPLQLIIAGPAIRFAFRQVFPVGSIN